jgi:hypothetical protein
MLGVGRGRPDWGHLPEAYISDSGRLDTSIVPKLYPADWSISWLRQVLMRTSLPWIQTTLP